MTETITVTYERRHPKKGILFQRVDVSPDIVDDYATAPSCGPGFVLHLALQRAKEEVNRKALELWT